MGAGKLVVRGPVSAGKWAAVGSVGSAAAAEVALLAVAVDRALAWGTDRRTGLLIMPLLRTVHYYCGLGSFSGGCQHLR